MKPTKLFIPFIALALLIAASTATAKKVDSLQAGENFTISVDVKIDNGQATVTKVWPGRAGQRHGLDVGDIVYQINDQRKYINPTDFYNRIKAQGKQFGGSVLVKFKRKDATGKLRYKQTIIALDAMQYDPATRGFTYRGMDHAALTRYVYETEAVNATYKDAWKRLIGPNASTKASVTIFGTNVLLWGSSMKYVNLNGAKLDLRKAHEKYQNTLIAAGLKLMGEKSKDPQVLMQLLETWKVKVGSARQQWSDTLKKHLDDLKNDRA